MKYLFVVGIVLLIGAIILIYSNYEQLNVEKNGKIVKMTIVGLPKSCIGAKVRYFVTYSYDGVNYDKATRGNYCETHYIGQLIDMKVLEGSNTILRPDESARMNLLSFVALGLLGAWISISQWHKMKT